jgi:hypothetical protein
MGRVFRWSSPPEQGCCRMSPPAPTVGLFEQLFEEVHCRAFYPDPSGGRPWPQYSRAIVEYPKYLSAPRSPPHGDLGRAVCSIWRESPVEHTQISRRAEWPGIRILRSLPWAASRLNSLGRVADIEFMQFSHAGVKRAAGGTGQVMGSTGQMITPAPRGGSKRHPKARSVFLI